MSWQVQYALNNIRETRRAAEWLRGDAITISLQTRGDVVAVISDAYAIDANLAAEYHAQYPEMDFLCGFRRECVWEGAAISYLENLPVGWGSAGTLGNALSSGDVRRASHKDYFFSYRLIRQIRSISDLKREFDRVFTMVLRDGRNFRVGMIMEYEPTANAIRTFWDRFGPINIAWNINPNGTPTREAINAAQELGCEVMKWDQLRLLLRAE